MFAKIFSQIYDSSIVENPDTRFTFMDMLVLADQNGVVDITHEAIARRTNRPIALIRETIAMLERGDSQSRTPGFDGARIKRLDDHRDWGWMIINYDHFRKIASEEQRREKTLARVHKHRNNSDDSQEKRNVTVTPCNVTKRSVTLSNACNAKQKQKQKQEDITAAIESQTAFLEEETSVDDHQSSNDHRRFIKLWTEEFPKFHDETKYSFCGAKDGNAVKRLLKVTSVERLIVLAKRAWRNGGMFNCKFSATINGFAARFNEIQEELRQLDKV